MDLAHLHVLLNHVPIIGGIFAVALLAIGMIFRSVDVTRVGLLALVVVALFTFPTHYTGEPAEKVAEHLPGVTHDVIEAHEDAALWGTYMMYATGVAALAALVLNRSRRAPRWLNGVVLLLAIVSAAAMVRVGFLGGQVRHTEFRPGAEAPAADP
jgi:uncharacterized membrane protein